MNGTAQPPASPLEVTAENLEQVLQDHGCHGADFGILSKGSDFNEEFVRGKTDPLIAGGNEFPFDEVARRLDGEPEQITDSTQPDAAELLRMLMEWLKADSKMRRDERAIVFLGKRAIAMMWCINPALFGNVPGHVVAESYGISSINFSRETADFSRRFHFRNQFQVHDAKNRP